jgi:hypothetical protein
VKRQRRWEESEGLDGYNLWRGKSLDLIVARYGDNGVEERRG